MARIGLPRLIMSGRGPEVALTIAIPDSIKLAQTLGILVRVVNARFGHLADRSAARYTRMVGLMHLAGPTLLYFFKRISTGIFCHSAWFFGGKLFLLEAIPPVITNGLIVASKILPALGFSPR